VRPPLISLYTAQALVVTHTCDVDCIGVKAEILAGSGGGMGSQENFEFNTLNPIPYNMYGEPGTSSAFDTHPPAWIGLDHATITWPGHPMEPNSAFYFSDEHGEPVTGIPYYVIGATITPSTFQVSEKPYRAPGPPPFPQVPVPWVGVGLFWITAFMWTIPGSPGGGVAGDQAAPPAGAGFPFGSPAIFKSGCCGSNGIRGGGGRGGGAGGAVEQIGPMAGNVGNDRDGGGGSGAGMAWDHPIGSGIRNLQWGPGGGASGGKARIWPELKPKYRLLAGAGGLGGPAGPGGFAGGRGAHGAVRVIEKLRDL